MSDAFFDTSKTIANDFLQSVVFIDDQAFTKNVDANKGNPGNKNQEFDAGRITRSFANKQKVCAVYRPESIDDINNLAILAKKADITVLDWHIEFEELVTEGDGEEDVEVEDPRGVHTKMIIREILADPLTGKGSLKLILIYTGETDLPGITNALYDDLLEQNNENVQKGDCTVFTENIRVLVLAKQAGEGQFKHNPELKNKIVSYEDLPDFILTQFTEMTSGLLTNFVLQSLTAVRANTFRLIKLYKKELDPSFLAHRLLLPNPEDSKEQLIEIFSHSIQALLNYNQTAEIASIPNLEQWVDQSKFNKSIEIEKGKQLLIDNAFIKEWINSTFIDACRNQWITNKLGMAGQTPDKKFRSVEKELYKSLTAYMVDDLADSIDSEFSILTHHKSNLKQPSTAPRLTLGTLIKQELPEQEERYYLCIQARCDSVRVDALRKFLFLPLEKVDGNSKFHFVVEENEFTKLRIIKEAFELRTIKFNPNAEHKVVLASEADGKYCFESNHGERFQWLADLKEAHAQREVNNFAAKISRVGLDESEWLRRWAT